MSKKYVFRTELRWSGFKRGSVSSPGKLNIGVATPPEFNGEEGYWSPEELLLSAVDSCIMTTFLHYAERKKIEFKAYESETEGVLERIDDQFMFSNIKIKPTILVMSEDQVGKVKELMTIAENNCFISNSIKSTIEVIPEIKVGI
ncbi:OsmC family protein [Patescibacteria group bacterium]|nr:OsmC family protein [Candidatus Omnitrophota bacterium]MBU1128340.1 OsmC family protein [Candidatus Omnitrophota bacterium]MBU1685663.1 OsmC family protein [Patescibacteria group bacterium]MBU1784984.1 OsmC family protein [Candidatus Omnitrophota bacterium]MBU1851857.1 OsmC family protein [Candidatus Omnitrophota bacterium]